MNETVSPEAVSPETVSPGSTGTRGDGDIARSIALAAAAAAEEKGHDVVVLEVGPTLGICDFFVLASGRNPLQVRAVVDEVERVVAERTGIRPRSVEGADTRRWVVLDYGDVVVHVFHEEDRAFYRLERLYGDAPRVDWGSFPATE